MTGRFLLAVLLTLSLAGQILGQSLTSSGSVSLAASVSASVPPPPSVSVSYTNSISAPVPAAPINLTNHFPNCALRPDHTNHIYYLCIAWSDPTLGSASWIVTYTPTGGSPTSVTVYYPAVYLPGLTPGTTYAISIVGVNTAGTKSLPLTGSYATDPTDAKTAYKTKDLLNLNCTNGVNSVGRKVINCGWGSPPLLPSRIDVKARCVATGSKNKIVHESLKGSATAALIPVHRNLYSCYIEIFGVYPLSHKANNYHGHKFVVTCSSATGCVNVH